MKKMQYSERKFIIRGIFLPNSKISTHKREAEKGFGDNVPKQGMGWQPHRNPVPIKKEVVSEQNAKHSTIETGLR